MLVPRPPGDASPIATWQLNGIVRGAHRGQARCIGIAVDRMPGIKAGREPGWVDGLEVIPARAGDVAPYGTWAVDRVWVDGQPGHPER